MNSADHLAKRLLAHCLGGTPWPAELLDHLLEGERSQALFRIVVERLSDLFEPGLCEVYAELFSEAIARTIPDLHAEHLTKRYERVRNPRRFAGDAARVQKVFVLSRVTLGADIAITSIALDAAKRKFPKAAIFFAGPRKGWELFAEDPRIGHLPVMYGRGGTLEERLSVWPSLRQALSAPDSIVIDPDSRLTQLGLLPVCPEENYYFFESRSYGGDSHDSLPTLTKHWVEKTFGVTDAVAYIAPELAEGEAADVTISFGVGENPAKRIADPFEEELLRSIVAGGKSVLIDKGAGGEEAVRVESAIEKVGGKVRAWDGSFAGFASHIARSGLYVGYDSAGGHAAAACGVPLISVFAGQVSDRMFDRWRPDGPGRIEVVRATTPEETLARIFNSRYRGG